MTLQNPDRRQRNATHPYPAGSCQSRGRELRTYRAAPDRPDFAAGALPDSGAIGNDGANAIALETGANLRGRILLTGPSQCDIFHQPKNRP